MSNIESMKKDFIKKVKYHDVTFQYSDDNSVWRRGITQLEEIKELATQLPKEFVTEVWNKQMDYCFTAEEAPHWYWRW